MTDSETVEFKRVGPPKVIAKDANGFLTVEISLNSEPDYTWKEECFKRPTTYTPNEAHPSRSFVVMNKITFTSHESSIKPNIEWMDKYIQQANECYNRKKKEQLLEEKRLLEMQRKRKEELDRINETLKDL